jgi:hypothetical protein
MILWERHLAAILVAESHSHNKKRSCTMAWYKAPQVDFYKVITNT